MLDLEIVRVARVNRRVASRPTGHVADTGSDTVSDGGSDDVARWSDGHFRVARAGPARVS